MKNAGYNMATIKDKFKKQGIFHTTSKVAELLKSYIDIPYTEVYDPTCGTGQLLSVFPDETKKFGQEISEEQVQIARENLVNAEIEAGDTLTDPFFINKKFDVIVANYPFSIAWDEKESDIFGGYPCLPPKSKADYAFIAHILYLLSDKGIAVTLNFPGILYRGGREGKIRKHLIEQNLIEKVIAIPPKEFIDTPISTVVLIFRKNKKDTNIEFIDGDKSYVASIDEIKDNDYELSVPRYIFEEEEKEEINEEELQESARNHMINILRKDLRFDKQVCELTGMTNINYLERLKDIIDEFK